MSAPRTPAGRRWRLRLGPLDWLRIRVPLLRLSWRYAGERDAWRAVECAVPLELYGTLQHDFAWYLEGPSAVPVDSIDTLCGWLVACEYVRDPDLFHLRDFWQHPRTFEQIRKGDCEDHALWAWRAMRDLGVSAELMVGRWRHGTSRGRGSHAWLVFTAHGERWLLETVAKDPAAMLRPLAGARDEYLPHFSVDHRLTRRLYAGIVASADGTWDTTAEGAAAHRGAAARQFTHTGG